MSSQLKLISIVGVAALGIGSIVAYAKPQPSPPKPQPQNPMGINGPTNSPPKPPKPQPAVPSAGGTNPTTQPSDQNPTWPGYYNGPYGTGPYGQYGPYSPYGPYGYQQPYNNGQQPNNNNGNMAGQAPPAVPAPAAPPPAPTPKPAPDPVIATPAPPPDPVLTQATADLNSAMDHLRAQLLKDDAEYQLAASDKKAAQAEVSDLRQKEDATPDAILAAAKKVLAATERMTKIERAAIAKDHTVLDAQAHLKEAQAAHNAAAAPTASSDAGKL